MGWFLLWDWFQAEEWQILLNRITLAAMLKRFKGSRLEAVIIIQAWDHGGLGHSSGSGRLLEVVRFVACFASQTSEICKCVMWEKKEFSFFFFLNISLQCIFLHVQVDTVNYPIYFMKCIMLCSLMWAVMYSFHFRICLAPFSCLHIECTASM